MKIKDVLWFTPMNLYGVLIGIVKTTDNKFYIGISNGENEQKDIEHIKETGVKIPHEMILKFFKECE